MKIDSNPEAKRRRRFASIPAKLDAPSFEQTSGPRPLSKTEQAAGKRAAFHVFYEAGRGCRTRIYFDPVFPAQADTPEAAARFIQAVLVEVREPRARVVRVHTITDA